MKTKVKTKPYSKCRRELIPYVGCRVIVEGTVKNFGRTERHVCLKEITINGDKIKSDHLRVRFPKHYFRKGDRVKFKGFVDKYEKKEYSEGGIHDYIINFGVTDIYKETIQSV